MCSKLFHCWIGPCCIWPATNKIRQCLSVNIILVVFFLISSNLPCEAEKHYTIEWTKKSVISSYLMYVSCKEFISSCPNLSWNIPYISWVPFKSYPESECKETTLPESDWGDSSSWIWLWGDNSSWIWVQEVAHPDSPFSKEQVKIYDESP